MAPVEGLLGHCPSQSRRAPLTGRGVRRATADNAGNCRTMPSPIDLEKAPPRAVLRFGLALRRLLHAAGDALVPPQVRAYEVATSFFSSRLAGALVELGVIDAVGTGSRTAADLAVELELDEDTLHRALRLAAARDIGRLDRRSRFSLTATGLALRSDASPTIGPWARHLATDAVQRPWAALADAIRTGEPPFPRVYGKSVWQHLAENPEEERLFAESMRELTALSLAWIVRGYPWPERGVVADVAGGSGPVLAGVLNARPGLRGILIEAPGVLEEASRHLERAGVRDRVELREGDIFERVEAEADVYTLKDILHDWDDERCLRILRTVAAGMTPGSKLVVIEQLLDRNEVEPIAAGVDIHMLAQCDGGRQRSATELRALMSEAGLRPGRVLRSGPVGLLEGLR